mmetsp:Transcript_51287/g.133906  ORF Transcript_51287/g.133906 Transcript_51287/m.133906 type:complete len:626 (-) Transcript_51287:753-2630(-)
MAPKRDSKKKGKDEAPEGPTTLYVKREPQARREAPDSAEAAEAWKTVRGMYMMPLPVWDDKAVNETEWKPAEVEARYTSAEFSAKTVPKSFAQNVTAWKRAVAATDSNGVEEPEPLAEPIPEVEEEPPAPDPKAKAKADAKSKAKAKAKGKGDESDPGEKRTTAQQFEGIVPEGDMCVVTTQEFRSREFTLTSDDALPPLSQAISAQFAIIGEHKNLFPTGQYLWELIYPQNAEGFPLINPHGKYVVRLFLMGAWRQVTIDDVVPVGGADKAGCASLFPACVSSTVQWPLLLTKALMRAFQADLAKSTMLPVVTALTGWLPYQTPLSFDSLSRTHSTRPFCCVQLQSQIDQDAKQREALAAASTQPEGGRKGGGGAPAPPVPALNLPGQAPVLAPVPKLNAGPNDAVPMQFLVCEVEGDPQQVRLKSAAWRPAGGTPRKTVMKEADSEGDEAEEPPAMLRIIVAPAKASTLGVAASSGRTVGLKFVELLSLGGLGMMPSRDPLGDLRFHESRRPEVEPAPPPKEPLVERPEQPCCCCSQRKFASASRGPRLASKASSGDGSPSLLWQKGCSNKACAAGRSLGSKLRQAERKERKPSLENVFATSGSLKPVGGFVMMTNMARDGGI